MISKLRVGDRLRVRDCPFAGGSFPFVNTRGQDIDVYKGEEIHIVRIENGTLILKAHDGEEFRDPPNGHINNFSHCFEVVESEPEEIPWV